MFPADLEPQFLTVTWFSHMFLLISSASYRHALKYRRTQTQTQQQAARCDLSKGPAHTLQDLSETHRAESSRPSLTSESAAPEDHQRLSVNHGACVSVCVCVWSGFFIISDPRHGNKHSRHRSSVLTLEKLLPLKRRSEERRRTLRTQPKRSEHLNTCAYRPRSRFNIHNHRSFSLSCLWTICSINDSSDEFRTSPTYTLCSSETGYLRKVPQTEVIKS